MRLGVGRDCLRRSLMGHRAGDLSKSLASSGDTVVGNGIEPCCGARVGFEGGGPSALTGCPRLSCEVEVAAVGFWRGTVDKGGAAGALRVLVDDFRGFITETASADIEGAERPTPALSSLSLSLESSIGIDLVALGAHEAMSATNIEIKSYRVLNPPWLHASDSLADPTLESSIPGYDEPPGC